MLDCRALIWIQGRHTVPAKNHDPRVGPSHDASRGSWYQQTSVGEFLVNLNKKWQELSEEHRRMIEVACDANILATMRSAWEEVIAEESAKDPDFKRAHESYADFRKKYAIWREHGYLK